MGACLGLAPARGMEDWKAKVREKALVIADKAKEKAVEVSEKAAVVSETARVRLEKELEEARTARAETLSALYQELDVLRAFLVRLRPVHAVRVPPNRHDPSLVPLPVGRILRLDLVANTPYAGRHPRSRVLPGSAGAA